MKYTHSKRLKSKRLKSKRLKSKRLKSKRLKSKRLKSKRRHRRHTLRGGAYTLNNLPPDKSFHGRLSNPIPIIPY